MSIAVQQAFPEDAGSSGAKPLEVKHPRLLGWADMRKCFSMIHEDYRAVCCSFEAPFES